MTRHSSVTPHGRHLLEATPQLPSQDASPSWIMRHAWSKYECHEAIVPSESTRTTSHASSTTVFPVGGISPLGVMKTPVCGIVIFNSMAIAVPDSTALTIS